ncbi:MAG: formate dehydrogenase accessory sulfurtransferase FdhD [Pseudomonadota bacterium]
MSASSQEIKLQKVAGDCANAQSDRVAVEEPLEIRLGFATPDGRTAKSISITMRTPGHDEELALGFLYTEGIITGLADVSEVAHCGPPAPDTGNHNIIRVDLADGVAVDIGKLQRNFYTTSSCGVCGKSSLDALRVTGAAPIAAGGFKIPVEVLTTMPDKLRDMQATFDQTGGLHAAAAFDSQGEIIVTREDVGRHNAVDKVAGALYSDSRLPASDMGLLVSGRASFELMQKALMCGMPLLAAVSAPSSLAVRLAEEFDVTLVGFLRGDTFNIYSGGERVS